MTLDEFEQKFCKLCGTQLCGGVLDEELREGCLEYRYYFPHGERTAICGADGCDGCLFQHTGDIEICKKQAKLAREKKAAQKSKSVNDEFSALKELFKVEAKRKLSRDGSNDFDFDDDIVDDIVCEAIRLVKKDDSFWDCIDYAVENAIDNIK